MANKQLHRRIVKHKEKVQLRRRELFRIKLTKWTENIILERIPQENFPKFAVF
jgi:hypothetical protein